MACWTKYQSDKETTNQCWMIARFCIMMPTLWMPGNYPPTCRSDHINVYKSALQGKVHIPNPYRWLEEYSDEVDNQMTAPAAFTQAYLNQNADMQRLVNKFHASMNYTKVITWLFTPSSCLCDTISCISLRPVCLMMDRGIGSTIVVYNPNQVWICLSL